MANQNSTEYAAAYVTEPASKLQPDKLNGKIRRIYSSITISGNVLAIGDTLSFCKLPANAVIIEARFQCADLGTTGVLDLGWAASADANEAADPNGIISGMDATAAIDSAMAWTDAAFNKRFAEEVDIQAVATTATDAADGLVAQVEIRYIVD